MKIHIHLTLLFLSTSLLHSQSSFREISTGNSYVNQVFFTLEGFESTAIPNESWDLAFTAFGLQDAGIHINESAALTNTPPPLELYYAPTNNFTDEIATSDIVENRLVNSEESWSNGAFNSGRMIDNPLDYGWGMYNPQINQVIGNKVFVIKMRDGSYQKMKIDSLVSSTYYFRHADLDGSNERAATIDKADFADAGFAFFSFSSNTTISTIPEKWDLMYGRYQTILPQDSTSYEVTGILSHPNLKIAEVKGVAVADVDVSTNISFEDRIDVIGSDWKRFDFQIGWVLQDSLSYIVKMPDNHLYKLVFVDFSGSSSGGTATFEQIDLGLLSSNHHLAPKGASWSIYPNPIQQGRFTLSLDLVQQLGEVEVSLYNVLGQPVWHRSLSTEVGLSAFALELPAHIPTGQYWLRLQATSGQLTKTVFVR